MFNPSRHTEHDMFRQSFWLIRVLFMVVRVTPPALAQGSSHIIP
jgi:hypothetical protein